MSDTSRVVHATGLYASFTVDDLSAGDGRRVGRLLQWLADQELRATFFVIPFSYPNQAPLDEDADLVAALRDAVAAGHEVQPHGYDHELFECGLPDLMAVQDEAMLGKVARALSREEFQLRHTHTRGMIGARISRALRILASAFPGYQPSGFRSGYHEFCRELYFALEDCKIRWSSSRTATPQAYRPRVTEGSDEVISWIGLLPYWVGGVLEIPHCADYGSHLPPEDIAAWVGLARRHLAACEDARAPFVCCAHMPGLACAGDPPGWRDAGYRSYEQVIAAARQDFGAEFVTLGELADHALATPSFWPQRDEYRR
ncbi:MAG: DUF2334 domain-containing protein [Fimbriimonadaceae bacterium]|nr:DUF2334 domain-containing protein [Fimbriimonadaceae bacterium]